MRAALLRAARPTAPAAVAVVLLAACGGGAEPAVGHRSPGPGTGTRARQVAVAWDGSPAARAWRTGYHPTGDATQLPGGGPRSASDRHAYDVGDFTLVGALPAPPRHDGRVVWTGGGSLARPLLTARAAYGALDRADSTGPTLTVTAVRLGTMTQATGRGPATVPAWLFTLKGYDTPLRRAAVLPSAGPKPPIGPVAERSAALTKLAGLVAVSGDGRSVTVRATHGSCDDGPAVDVLETDGSVVLSGSVKGVREGPCDSSLSVSKATVRLAAPLGDRVPLDAFTGLPVPWGGSLPWS